MSYKKLSFIICLSVLCVTAVSCSRTTSNLVAAKPAPAAGEVAPTPTLTPLAPAPKSNQTKIVSGEYDQLLLGVDENGELTGYYNDSTGAGQFTCIFYIRGKLQSDAADITTWFPKDKEKIRGKLKFVEEDGKPGVNIKLESEPGGCWNVNPEFDEENGSTLGLNEPGDWQAVRVVSAKKAFFHNRPNRAAQQKTFVVTGDGVRVFKTQNGFAEAEFENNCIDADCLKSKITRGWLPESDLFSAEPPK